jgi:hypothetical protein
MNLTMKRIALTAGTVLLLVVAAGCNDSNKQEAPVRLLVSNSQTLHTLDLAGDPAGQNKCQQSIGTIILQSQTVEPATTNPTISTGEAAALNTITVDRYQVSYQRVDGGRLVPSPFIRSTGVTLAPNSTAPPTTFVIFDPNALAQAPFASLLPQNGGVDPETGRPAITMDVIVTFFGTTLAGERVSGSTRFSLSFCYLCGGCS